MREKITFDVLHHGGRAEKKCEGRKSAEKWSVGGQKKKNGRRDGRGELKMDRASQKLGQDTYGWTERAVQIPHIWTEFAPHTNICSLHY